MTINDLMKEREELTKGMLMASRKHDGSVGCGAMSNYQRMYRIDDINRSLLTLKQSSSS